MLKIGRPIYIPLIQTVGGCCKPISNEEAFKFLKENNMATKIRETETLYGEDAEKFLKDVEDNLKKDCTEAFERARKIYDPFKKEEKNPSTYTTQGWECPRCHTIHAPWVQGCYCANVYPFYPEYPHYPYVTWYTTCHVNNRNFHITNN